MAKFVVYQIWTKDKVVEANSRREAFDIAYPDEDEINHASEIGLHFSNWHVVKVEEDVDAEQSSASTGLEEVAIAYNIN